MKKIIPLLGIIAATISANAQVLSQGTFTDNTVLALAGSSANELYGVSFGDATAQTTANGYVFSASPNPTFGGPPNVSWNFSAGFYSSFGTFNTGDAAFNTVLHDGEGLDGSTTPTALTLNNLTSGATYNALLFTADSRPGLSTRSLTVADGAQNASQQYNNNGAAGGYIMDTFVAGGTTHVITVGGVGGDQLNGLLVVSSGGVTPPPSAPAFASTSLAGSNFIFTGTNGTASASYRILTSTIVTAPVATWSLALSGSFDGSGNFSNSIPVNPATPAAFYRLVTP